MYKKKSLGQHFLHAPAYLNKIIEAAKIAKGEWVLEVGPGDGALTDKLLEQGARLIAVEKDARMIPLLKNKYSDVSLYSLTIIEEDILRFDISNHLPQEEMYKVVANIPYYITGAFLKKFLSAEAQPSSMVLLVQKEVAERIVGRKSAKGGSASGGKESILSLSVKAYGEPIYIKTVPSGAFSPPPQVDSAILAIGNISRERFTNLVHENRFFELVRTGFAQKRKLLGRNLEPILGPNYADLLKMAGIPEKARAEDVPLEKWLSLSEL
ncbi:ribosomal RNA small subunit methyltransferase A [Acetobacteraceae bacterium]|nr:ribosomal RNA small subunit methyltransferase A [Candidatus Parcubacteria bacterium]